jgi:hypothetical protein
MHVSRKITFAFIFIKTVLVFRNVNLKGIMSEQEKDQSTLPPVELNQLQSQEQSENVVAVEGQSELSEYETETDSETETETDLLNYGSEEIHDEIECMLSGTNQEILELIATDPKYYFDLVEHYTHMRDGCEIYLPDLFNLLIKRSNGRLTVKFKMSDNTQWYEIGYSGGDFNDDNVYKSFTEKIDSLVKNPAPVSHRELLNDTMKPDVKEAPVMVNQGNQNKLTKIDRFLGRTQHAQEGPSYVENVAAPPVETETQVPLQDPAPTSPIGQGPITIGGHTVVPPVQREPSSPADVGGVDVMLDTVIELYTQQLSKRLQDKIGSGSRSVPVPVPVPVPVSVPASSSGLGKQLQGLRSLCPGSKKSEFNQLVSLLTNSSPFVSGVVETLSKASPGQQVLLLNFLKSENTYNQSELLSMLDLTPTDHELIKQYNIDLTTLI